MPHSAPAVLRHLLALLLAAPFLSLADSSTPPASATPPAFVAPAFGTVARASLHARDGCVWPDATTQTYVLYFATRGPHGRAAVAAYTSKDLERWTGPTYVFERPAGWWADRGIWAPEMHAYRGKYCLFLTFDSAPGARAIPRARRGGRHPRPQTSVSPALTAQSALVSSLSLPPPSR